MAASICTSPIIWAGYLPIVYAHQVADLVEDGMLAHCILSPADRASHGAALLPTVEPSDDILVTVT
jgi:hypothetical protein